MERRLFLKGLMATAAMVGVAPRALAAERLNRLENPHNPSTLEKKHVPAIIAPGEVRAGQWFEVQVRVGYLLPHPSLPEHWIDEISLRFEGKTIAKVNYPQGGVASSLAVFKIRLSETGTLEAVEHCNLHGWWLSEPRVIKVI